MKLYSHSNPLLSIMLIMWAVALSTLCSCGSINAEDALQQAESDLQTGNLQMAVDGCALLSDSTANLSSEQMCRVAIIYAKISEMSDEQDYMASATRCYERAVTLDQQTGTLDSYIESLDLEDQCVVRVIREVSQALNSTDDIMDHDEESIEEIVNNLPLRTAGPTLVAMI